jgi:hypothetical protein
MMSVQARLVRWLLSGWYIVVIAIVLASLVHFVLTPRIEGFVGYWYDVTANVSGQTSLGMARQAEWQRTIWERLFLLPIGLLLLMHLTGLAGVFSTREKTLDTDELPARAAALLAEATLLRPSAGDTTTSSASTQVRPAVRLETAGPRVIGPHDRYRLEKLLGSGGMGSVYLGFDQVLQRKVALKSLHLELARGDEDQVARFRKEAHSLAGLSHNHIVPVYDLFECGDEFWMVLEFLSGGDLDVLIERKRPTIKQSIAIIKAIARGLDYAHSKGFVHRDVKPANILFSEEHLPKLVDFGIAKGGQSEQVVARTQAGMSLGSPTYMSPEQAQGKSDIDRRSDIYSLGITFYKLLCGDVPFKADDVSAVMVQHITQAPPSLCGINSDVSPGLDAIVMKMLAKERDGRYQNLGEFIVEIDNYARSAS